MSRRWSSVIALASVVGVVGAAWSASACFNPMLISTRAEARGVARARTDLEAGRPARALRRTYAVERAMERKRARVERSDEYELPRSFDQLGMENVYVRNVAIVHLGGAVRGPRHDRRLDPASRGARLEEARSALSELLEGTRREWRRTGRRGVDSVAELRFEVGLLEASLAVDPSATEPLDRLRNLAGRDILTSASGYAALAAAEQRAGQSEAALRAHARCEAMAPRGAARRVCGSAPEASPPAEPAGAPPTTAGTPS